MPSIIGGIRRFPQAASFLLAICREDNFYSFFI
jgi:hypothetical protein